MEDVLKKIFAAHPGKSTMEINGKCPDCGRKVTVIVEVTSGGYGLMGGVLDKAPSGNYSVTCLDCYKLNLKIAQQRTANATTTG